MAKVLVLALVFAALLAQVRAAEEKVEEVEEFGEAQKAIESLGGETKADLELYGLFIAEPSAETNKPVPMEDIVEMGLSARAEPLIYEMVKLTNELEVNKLIKLKFVESQHERMVRLLAGCKKLRESLAEVAKLPEKWRVILSSCNILTIQIHFEYNLAQKLRLAAANEPEAAKTLAKFGEHLHVSVSEAAATLWRVDANKAAKATLEYLSAQQQTTFRIGNSKKEQQLLEELRESCEKILKQLARLYVIAKSGYVSELSEQTNKQLVTLSGCVTLNLKKNMDWLVAENLV